ncbi:MAG: cyclic pyranopterin monophosphate synthase MoaC [Bacteroidota bacterium]|jgi:cyclic pyranopterin phosphate synthase
MSKFSHINADGLAAMVGVQHKDATLRTATAQSVVELPPEVIAELFVMGALQSPKGNVFQTAILAGIMAAKKTGELIPLCHPIGMDQCHIDIHIDDLQRVIILCTATVVAKTGVEMEAMLGASIAALTVYDMCKALSHDIVVRETKLMSKTGGKRDFKRPS